MLNCEGFKTRSRPTSTIRLSVLPLHRLLSFCVGLQSSTSNLPSIAVDGCRVAPYVALPTMRLNLDSAVNGGGGSTTSTGASPPLSSLPAVSHSLPPALDPTLAAALTAAAGLQSAVPFLAPGSPLMAAAAAAAAANSMLLYGPPPAAMQYGLSLQAALRSSSSQATSGESIGNKNNSIAELRMKAKKYAAALGL